MHMAAPHILSTSPMQDTKPA
eukprot:SAG11_NODE_29903_length_306_cov_0.594203_1_plen_20_part_10